VPLNTVQPRTHGGALVDAPRTFGHRIDPALVSDEALTSLLDRYPAELFDINLYDFDDEGQVSLRTGVRGGLSGGELLDAIKQGRLWINLREAADGYPELWAQVVRAFEDLKRDVPGFEPIRFYGQLILSSPQAKVPYHADPGGVVLFHLRGRKRIWIYPPDEAHMPEAHMERIVMRQTTEELPYHRAFDGDAAVFDLEPGQAVGWPFHAPHRIENLGEFCVSFSADYQTWGSRLLNGAYFTNGVLRAKGRSVRSVRSLSGSGMAARWAASTVLKRMGVAESRLGGFERSFEPSAEAVDGARPLA
jgi:hypothetical protein